MATRTKELSTTVNRNMANLSNLFQKRNFYPPVPMEMIRSLSNHDWHSMDNFRDAGENIACALIAAENNMPAQVKARTDRAFKAYDTDNVEGAIALAEKFYPKAKLFAVKDNLNNPIIVNGKDFIWEGQLLSDMNSFSRDDQMVPKDVMKRVKFLRNNGLAFEDGFALFWPQDTYEPEKASIADHQIDRLKDDLSMLATKTGNALKSGFGLIGSAARTGRNAIGTAFEVGRDMADVSIDNLANNLRTGVQVHDPVLAGVIAGSLARKRYFLIEVGRWVDTY